MSGRMNWRRVHARAQMRQWGSEDLNGGTSVHVLLKQESKRRQSPTKAELRKQAAAAFLAWRARQRSAS